ncbi:MAG TPA: hypothetical protein DEA71_16025 [Nitrospira sp.]|jgi:hypothetical protein|nr:hypothetical protein [Nitrospira sp.]
MAHCSQAVLRKYTPTPVAFLESREAFTNPDHFRIAFVVRPSVCYPEVAREPNVPAILSLALFLPCRR